MDLYLTYQLYNLVPTLCDNIHQKINTEKDLVLFFSYTIMEPPSLLYVSSTRTRYQFDDDELFGQLVLHDYLQIFLFSYPTIIICCEHNFLFIVQSRAINFGRQGHSLTQSKMLHCKTVLNVITYHHVV
jgi:hypothetical protein